MTSRRRRILLDCEIHCGCPSCGARPGERCTVITSRYGVLGQIPTQFHMARLQLYRYLRRGLWNTPAVVRLCRTAQCPLGGPK